MAAASSGPPKLPASDPDFERPSGPDDADLLVPADTFDISKLRPGWRRANESARPLQQDRILFETDASAAAPRLVLPPPPPRVPPTAPNNLWDVIRKDRVIAAGTIALAVVIALPWLLLWSGEDAAGDRAAQQVVRSISPPEPRPASPPEPRLPSPPEPEPAVVPDANAPREPGVTAQPQVTSPVPAVVHPTPPEAERRAAPPLARTTPPRTNDSSGVSDRVVPPAAAPTVPERRVVPQVAPSATPAPVDALPGDSRDEPPTPTAVAESTPAPAMMPSPASTPPPSLPPSPAIAAAPPPVSTPVAADEQLVAATLRRFANAYQQLDADAVAAVWPQADRRVLTRAFDSIESQQMYFEKCDVRVSDSGATASCGGWLIYVPKVGKKDPRSVSRQWDFALQKGGGEWRITTAAVR
jgi:hypothetical protein